MRLRLVAVVPDRALLFSQSDRDIGGSGCINARGLDDSRHTSNPKPSL